MRKIALEEHFSLPWLPNDIEDMRARLDPAFYARISERMEEIGERRIAEMDRAGIDMMVLSLTAPGAQCRMDPREAVALAQRANDDLAGHVARRPDRFAGFAHLPMQSPEEATAELRRCVEVLGFRGALINGHSDGLYLDDPVYLPFWAEVERLGYPLYLHPQNMLTVPGVFDGFGWMAGATWGWMNETGAHALRLLFSGLFDRFPGLTIILGHMGEAIPFLISRIDSRYGVRPAHMRLPRKPSDYIRQNFMITTSGVNDPAPLACSIATMGADRVMFSVDYPFESSEESAAVLDNAPLDIQDKALVAGGNARRILKL